MRSRVRMPALCCAVTLASLLTGCQGDPPASPAPESAPEEQAEAPEESRQDLIRMSDTEFYLYDTRPMAGAARKPLIFIRASAASMGVDGGASVSFRDARAVIRSNDAATPEIVFQAEEGSFVENQRAYLAGKVVAQVGEMTVQLQDIEMNSPATDQPVVAETLKPVVIDGPGLHLRAESMRLYPDDKTFELSAGNGHIDFGSLQQ